MHQHVGNISGNIRVGGRQDLLVSVATNGHFRAKDIDVKEPLDLWLTGPNRKGYI
jgi:hypothetical protein